MFRNLRQQIHSFARFFHYFHFFLEQCHMCITAYLGTISRVKVAQTSSATTRNIKNMNSLKKKRVLNSAQRTLSRKGASYISRARVISLLQRS